MNIHVRETCERQSQNRQVLENTTPLSQPNTARIAIPEKKNRGGERSDEQKRIKRNEKRTGTWVKKDSPALSRGLEVPQRKKNS